MRGVVLHAPGDVRVEEVTEPLHMGHDQAAEGYRAMDERRAIKVLLRP